MKIKISKEISLPIDAVTQTLACIGRKGAGKTYLSTMIAEQMLDNNAQVVVLDPVGNWWGLRVGADGKSKGKDIFVIGGDHGDIPIVPEAGARIAKLLVEKSISAVLDVSSFRLGERKRFCTDFGEELLHLKKKQKTPVHIFIEEAQLIIPQRVGPDEARMVGAFEQIVRLGRNYGIGCTLVTQRPQSVNKEVLSQVECLCVLQVTGPHERKALEEWVQEAGADRKLIGELPGLERGEGYIWSPSWLRIYQRVHFSKKETFDASATPTVGAKTKAVLLSKQDVESLREDMKEVVAQVEKDNPVLLRKKIAELEKQVQERTSTLPPAMGVSQWFEYGKKLGYDSFFIKKELTANDTKWQTKLDEWKKYSEDLLWMINHTMETAKKAIKPSEDPMKINVYKTDYGKMLDYKSKQTFLPPIINHSEKVITNKIFKPGALVESNITGPEQRILDAIAWMESIGVSEPDQTAVAFLAGYTYGGGGFNNPKGALRTKGMIEYLPGNKIKLTEEGHNNALAPVNTPTTEELHRKVLNRLPGPETRLLQVLLDAYPNEVTNEELAEKSGYTFGSGGFNNPRGRLRSLGLIEYLSGGRCKARDILFL